MIGQFYGHNRSKTPNTQLRTSLLGKHIDVGPGSTRAIWLA